jgi:23S rRNA (uracil1939-C5)-methyltransferase
MLLPGQSLTLTIEKPAAGGRMIARHDGQVVLVGGAIPGERVRARVQRATRKVVYAETISVDDASADRRAWDGDIECGGCLYGHIAYARQLDLKAAVIADAFGRIGRIVLPSRPSIAPSPESGYRMRARLHVRALRLGFFREGTHEVCEPRQTRQLLPATADVVERVGALIRSLNLDAIREIELAENADASARVLAIDSVLPIDHERLEQIAAVDGLTGVVSARRTVGEAHVIDTIDIEAAKVQLRRHVLAFFQGNRFLLSGLAAHVIGQIEPGAHVIDLYAGGGLFSVAAAERRGAHVVAVEGDRIAAADLAANSSARSGITPVHQAVEEYLNGMSSKRRGADPVHPVVIADPPRTGMSQAALGGVVRLGASRIVYVSCDVATLARDARVLADAGYHIEGVAGFDLFPNTPHVETVVTFNRA